MMLDLFTPEGRELMERLGDAKMDAALQQAIQAWVSRMEGALYALRRSGFLKSVDQEDISR